MTAAVLFLITCTGSRYIECSSSFHHIQAASVFCTTLSQLSLLESRSTQSSTLVTLLKSPVHLSLKVTNCSFWHAAHHFLLLYVFLISLVHHHHSALLHRQTLIVFSTLILKLPSSQIFPLHSHLCLAQAHLLENGHSVFDSHWRW